ncbi:hypothetical protein H5410_013388, partial [Solanum commersonii]
KSVTRNPRELILLLVRSLTEQIKDYYDTAREVAYFIKKSVKRQKIGKKKAKKIIHEFTTFNSIKLTQSEDLTKKIMMPLTDSCTENKTPRVHGYNDISSKESMVYHIS